MPSFRHRFSRWVCCAAAALAFHRGRAAEFHVAPTGDDTAAGTAAAPFATLQRAQEAVRQRPRGEGATVWLHAGVHRLARPLVFTPVDGGTEAAPVVYAAVAGETAEVSGAQLLAPTWTEDSGGRWRASLPSGADFDQLLANGQKMIRARYPNFDPGEGFFGGLSRDATDPERLRRYADPVGMYVHGYHGLGWGSLHFQVREKSPDGRYVFEAGKDPRLTGGWQNKGRAQIAEAPFSPDQRFVENVLEELDAPKEWFLERRTSTLFFIPPAGADPRRMIFEAVTLKNLIALRGSAAEPVRYLAFRGLVFRRAGYTFMQTDTVPSGGDWRIFRGAAVELDGTENCAVRDCTFDGVGGNAIFVRNYNRGAEVTGCEFTHIGASAVLFDGDAGAVRSRWAHAWGWPKGDVGERPVVGNRSDTFLTQLPAAILERSAANPLIDLAPGPKTNNYPERCLVRDCLIHEIGTVEKQIAGVFISKARQIVVSHVAIYDVPRAAININDGMWGGHVIEWCDIFNTCLESREHGSINCWGRDRYWMRMSGQSQATPEEFGRMRDWSRLDAVDVITIRHNRVQCAAGYDIDLDDGSSNFEISGNLCLQGGIKLREGFYRAVSNNITPLVSMHVWYPDSHDSVTRNVIVGKEAYSPRGMTIGACKDAWLDFNLFAAYTVPLELQRVGLDRHSLTADPQFMNPGAGDYRVRPDSPANTIGFVNFPMDRFGVVSPSLKARAKEWSGLGSALTVDSGQTAAADIYQWQGATLRNLVNLGRESAVVSNMDLTDNRGILIKSVAAGSPAAEAKIPPDAVLVAVNGAATANIGELVAALRATNESSVRLKVLTATGYIEVSLATGGALPALVPGKTPGPGTPKVKPAKTRPKRTQP
jgi:hypothetical protein